MISSTTGMFRFRSQKLLALRLPQGHAASLRCCNLSNLQQTLDFLFSRPLILIQADKKRPICRFTHGHCILTFFLLFLLLSPSRYIKALATNIEKFVVDNITREAFAETYGARHVIHFKTVPADPRVKPYDGMFDSVFITNENGALTINIYKDRVTQVADTTGTLGLAASMSEGPLSVLQRKNIAKNEAETRPKYLKAIEEATGLDFDTEVDWADFAVATQEKGYKERVGDIVYDWYLKALSSAIVTWSKDSIAKESFVESFGERKLLSFKVVDTLPEKRKSDYYALVNVGGVLVSQISKSKITQQVTGLGDNIADVCSGDDALSVNQRKNIAKNSSDALPKHLKAIADATGIEFDVEAEWVEFAAATEEKGYKERVGDIVYDWYLKALAAQIVTFAKDPIQRESFVETFGGHKQIVFKIVAEKTPKAKTDYYSVTNADGVLSANIVKSKITQQASGFGDDLAIACSGDGPLTVPMRKNIADATKQMNEHLETINKASGIEFEVEADWAIFAEATVKKGYHERVGDIVYNWYLKAIAKHVAEFCKHPIQREAFNEAFGSRKQIVFFLADDKHPDRRSTYHYTLCKDGVLQVHIVADRFTQVADGCGDDLAQSTSGEGPLSVTTRKNISDTSEARAGFVGRMNKAAGIDFEYEVDWESVAEAAKKANYEGRAGDVVGWYLKGLAENVEKVCADEMGKEAFAETCEKKNMLIKCVPQEETPNYVSCDFADGVLVVSIGRDSLGTNPGNAGSDIMSRL